jgi:hypothetical protein
MSYLIVSDAEDVDEYLVISEQDALVLQQRMQQLIAAADLEELYDLLVSDYLDFEAECLSAALDHSAGRCQSIEDFDRVRRQFNSRMMHLLTLARTYLDCAPKLISKAIGSCTAARRFRELASLEFDSRLGYRVLEALRNSAQHYGLPLHGLQAGLTWIPNGDLKKGRAHKYLFPTVSLAALARDKKFKKRPVFEELKQIGTNFDIRLMVRDYLEGLSTVQFELRLFATLELKRAHQAVEGAIERWKVGRKEVSEEVGERNLFICELDLEGTRKKPTLLTLRPSQMFDQLSNRNPQLANLRLSFVSNSVDEFGSMKSAKGELGR